MRSKETIEAFGEETRESSEQVPKQRKRPGRTKEQGMPDACKPFQWQKGQSGNPGGRPKRDFAAELCRAVIEQNPDDVYQGLLRTLRKGSAFALQVASDRGYGKLTDKVHVSGEISLAERIERARKKVAEKNSSTK